jgi:hypothetical protein
MEKVETIIRYVGSPFAFAILLAGAVLLGAVFLIVGTFSYLKLSLSSKMGPGVF